MAERENKAISEIDRQLKIYKKAEFYCHPLAVNPLNDTEKARVFERYRTQGYNITPKRNSHNIKYFLIS